ncbi:MAG TPA: sigma-70 family RNA polymerase sigma factor [Longimicrobiaceae bacterium]
MAQDGARLLEEHLPEIERIVEVVCRRRGVSGDEADDFRSWALERLIEADYAILGKFRGDSSLRTYLVVVVNNLFRDHIVRLRGRWRPSAQAQRMGTVGVALEELLHRKGRTLGEASAELRSRGVCDLSVRRLAELAALLPDREPLRPERVDPVVLESVPGGGGADGEVLRAESAERRVGVLDALEGALSRLAAEDRLIIRLRFLEGQTVADIARTLGLEQKPLYRRIERVLRKLRRGLEDRGVTGAGVAALLADAPPLDPEGRAVAVGFRAFPSVESGESR